MAGPQLPWHAAVAIVTVIAYSAVTLTLLFGYGMAAIVLSKTLLVFIAVLLFMTLVFVMSQILGRIDIVDAAWSLAFVIATITSLRFLIPYIILFCQSFTARLIKLQYLPFL